MPDSPPPQPENTGPTPPPVGPPTTGAGGEDAAPDYKALYEQTRTKLTAAEQSARDARAKAQQWDDAQAAQLSDVEKATARATEAETQVAALRRRAVQAEIRAAASGWADPSDAPRFLDDHARYVTGTGEIDTAAITADLAAELARRPHLARSDGPRRPAPDPSQGARQTGPAGLDEQIAAAEKAGDWATAITLKNQRLVAMPRPH
ncbi:hypothetical protein JOD54_001939 [Actinokineospora baliensis]|uniref:hypothetical protein n=1 Tax=Actinokineospora baliensis TaxID=547056 RepID=UPI001955FA21|nr:hypothetical protein [Actinokineospora baliensis]MBM7771735.1 hypothetical protein [Actinokineospora baliensis]